MEIRVLNSVHGAKLATLVSAGVKFIYRVTIHTDCV